MIFIREERQKEVHVPNASEAERSNTSVKLFKVSMVNLHISESPQEGKCAWERNTLKKNI